MRGKSSLAIRAMCTRGSETAGRAVSVGEGGGGFSLAIHTFPLGMVVYRAVMSEVKNTVFLSDTNKSSMAFKNPTYIHRK